METLAGQTEFLCLRCGLQGLVSKAATPDSASESSMLCPKCGAHVVTPQFLDKKEEPVLALV